MFKINLILLQKLSSTKSQIATVGWRHEYKRCLTKIASSVKKCMRSSTIYNLCAIYSHPHLLFNWASTLWQRYKLYELIVAHGWKIPYRSVYILHSIVHSNTCSICMQWLIGFEIGTLCRTHNYLWLRNEPSLLEPPRVLPQSITGHENGSTGSCNIPCTALKTLLTQSIPSIACCRTCFLMYYWAHFQSTDKVAQIDNTFLILIQRKWWKSEACVDEQIKLSNLFFLAVISLS